MTPIYRRGREKTLPTISKSILYNCHNVGQRLTTLSRSKIVFGGGGGSLGHAWYDTRVIMKNINSFFFFSDFYNNGVYILVEQESRQLITIR